MAKPSNPPTGRVPMVFAVFGAMGMLLVISLLHMHKAHTKLAVEHGQFQMLYNKWGTHDDNDHWGGVGSENYHTAKYDKSGSNENYHPRDSSSGTADAMEPAWTRPGPGANSEYTGHAMDGELYNPPDVKIFKPFMMKQSKARQTQLFDLDGPSPSDAPAASWAASGQGTAAWMLSHEGPLLAQEQEGLQDSRHPEQDTTAVQVKMAEKRSLAHWQAAHPLRRHVVASQQRHAAAHTPAARLPRRGVHAKDSILSKVHLRNAQIAAAKAAAVKAAAAAVKDGVIKGKVNIARASGKATHAPYAAVNHDRDVAMHSKPATVPTAARSENTGKVDKQRHSAAKVASWITNPWQGVRQRKA